MAAQESAVKMDKTYDKASNIQRLWLEDSMRALLNAAETVNLPADPTAAINVADFGCATGANSMLAMESVVSVLRKRCDNPIVVWHVDLPGNGWGQMHAAIAGEASYARAHANVYGACVGRSFYEQCLPPGTLDLALCSTSIHWLSRLPFEVASACSRTSLPPEESSALSARAAEDWLAFLRARAAELRPGGALVVVSTGAAPPPDASEAKREEWNSRLMERSREKAFKDLVEEGLIPERDLGRCLLPMFIRTEDDLRAPFESGAAEAADLRIESLKTAYNTVEAVLKWGGTPLTALDTAALASRFIQSFMGFARPTLSAALAVGRAEEEAKRLMARLEQRLVARMEEALPQFLAQDPKQRSSGQVELVIRRL